MAKVSYACKNCGREHTHRGYCWKCAAEYNAGPDAPKIKRPRRRTDGRGTALWRELRKLAWDRDDGTCQRCGHEIAEDEAWDLGHIVPVAEGGQLTLDNVRVECVPCNRSAKDAR